MRRRNNFGYNPNVNKLSNRKTKMRCALMTNPRKRIAANKLAASVQDTLPLGLSQPALRAFASAGYARLEHFTRIRETDLLKLHGVGPQAIRVLREALREQGKSFKEK